jgi:hypothetical protein
MGLSLGDPMHWSLILTHGEPPPPRYGSFAFIDERRDRLMIVSLGEEVPHAGFDVWALTLSGDPTWTPLATNTDPKFGPIGVVYDPANDALLVNSTLSFPSRTDGTSCAIEGYQWMLSLDTLELRRIEAEGSAPGPPRYSDTGFVVPTTRGGIRLELFPFSVDTPWLFDPATLKCPN